MHSLKLIILLFFSSQISLFGLSGDDPDPPTIVTPATDLEFPCGVPYSNSFNDWLNNNANFEVEDAGEVTYFNTFGDTDIDLEVASSSDTLCAQTASIPIGFYAIDDCGNVSDTSFARFNIVDLARPNFEVFAESVAFDCSSSLIDTLYTWLDNNGNAVASDLCSNVRWTHYIWGDNNGNSGTVEAGTATNIEINFEECEYFLNVSFFVADECGNSNVTTATFRVQDNFPPEIVGELGDTTILCTEKIDTLFPIFFDNCDDSVKVLLFEETTQNLDSTLCSHYNYQITREFEYKDACSNTNLSTQIITVVDTVGPMVFALDSLAISCTADDTDIALFIDSLVDCSHIITNEFKDSALGESNCESAIQREWVFRDICGNETQFFQKITFIDNAHPLLASEPEPLILSCGEQSNFQEELINYIDAIQDLNTIDDCSDTKITFGNSLLDSNTIARLQFIPSITCDINNQGILFSDQTNIIVSDFCQNDTTYTSSIQISDSSSPMITNCPDDIEIMLPDSKCDTLISITQLTFEDECQQVELPYLFYELKELPYSEEPLVHNYSWKIENQQSINEIESFSLELTFFNLNNTTEEDFLVNLTDDSGNELFNEIINTNCSTNVISIPLDVNLVFDYINGNGFSFNLSLPPLSESNCPGLPQGSISFNVLTSTSLSTSTFFKINNGNLQSISEQSDLKLNVGNHTINYYVYDCAGNVDSCLQNIVIEDQGIPQITCPDDITLEIDASSCDIITELIPSINLIEDCGNSFTFQTTLPEDDGSLQFIENNGILVPVNINFNFTNIEIPNNAVNPALIIEMLADTKNPNATFNINDESGNIIGITTRQENSCDTIITQEIPIDIDLLKQWNTDGQIRFRLSPSDNSQEGILPCTNGQNSYLKLSIAYVEIAPKYTVINVNTTEEIPFLNQDSILLERGSYEVGISIGQTEETSATCSYNIRVIDNIAPQPVCQNLNLVLPIVPDDAIIPTAEDFLSEVVDNCDTTLNLILEGPEINCLLATQSQAMYRIFAEDSSNNFSTCVSTLTVSLEEIKPSFSSSLCGGDDVFLFSNVDYDDSILDLDFLWTGPAGFVSSDENPIIPNAGTEYSGVYNLQITNPQGCVFDGTTSILIQGLDSPEITGNANLICEGETVILNSNSFSDDVTYLWYEGISPVGILVDETTGPSLEVNPSLGDHFYYVIVKGPSCQSNPSNTFNVEAIPFPTATVENAFVTICEGETINLSGLNFQAELEYEWNGPNGYSTSGFIPESIENASASNQGIYEFVATDRGCTSFPATTNVTVTPVPQQPIISGNNIYCEGTEIVLTVSNIPNADRYSWYLNNQIFSNTNENSLIIANANSNLSGLWSVIIEEDLCFSDPSNDFQVQVETNLMIGTANNGPACEGSEVTLSATFLPDAIYTWTSPNNVVYEGRIVTVEAIAGVYTVSVMTSSGCNDEGTTEVIVEAVPEITALSNSAPDCINIDESISFTPSVFPQGSYTYSWSGPNNFSSEEPNPTLVYKGIQNSGTYTLIIANENCASTPFTTVVSPQIIPEPAILSTTTQNCIGTNASITAESNAENIELYLWTTPLGQFTTSDPIFEINNIDLNDQGAYSVILEINGCSSLPSENVLLDVADQITTPIISGPNEICTANSVVLTPQPFVENSIYTWTNPAGIEIIADSLIIENTSSVDNGIYTVQLEVNGCLSGISPAFNLDVITLPNAIQLDNNNFSVCEDFMGNISLDIGGLQSAEELILYDIDNNIVATTVDGIFNEINLDNYTGENITFNVATVINGCESIDRTPLFIERETIPTEFTNFDSEGILFCELGQQEISINSPNVVSNFTIINNGEIIDIVNNNSSLINVNVFDIGEGELVIISSTENCTDYASDTLKIQSGIEIFAEADTFDIEESGIIELDILENDLYSEEVAITITSISNGINAIVNNGIIELEIPEIMIGQFLIEYELCYINCPNICSSNAVTLNIGDADNCIAYNMMTPNGDGQNDFFQIPCIDAMNGVPSILTIFNSWGDLIYSNTDYQNDWDGTRDGKVLPVGAYFYVLELGGQNKIHGFIIIEI